MPRGSEEQRQNHRQPGRAASPTEAQPEGRGCDRRRGGAEEGQSITHADRMHPEPPRAPTGAQKRHTLPDVMRGYPGLPHAAHSPSDAPQATQGGRSSAGVTQDMAHRQSHAEGAQMPHRVRSGARGTATHPQHQDEPQPPRMSRRGYEVHLFEYGDGAQPQSRKAARRKG